MNKLHSLGIFVGTGQCNAKCTHCAGVPLRKHAPKEDGIINEDLIYKTVKKCYSMGARYLSITSSGEPTLSPLAVTKLLKLIYECKKEGIKFSPVNLYTNGIIIGEDDSFCRKYLPLWKNYGLTHIYLTIHNIDEKKNAEVYCVERYPPLERVLSRVHNAGLLIRANLVLSKNTISTFEEFTFTIEHLLGIGVDSISAWPIRTLDDEVDIEMSPPEQEMDKMEEWIKGYENSGNVIRLLGKKNKMIYETGQKLTLFQDNTLSNTWCK